MKSEMAATSYRIRAHVEVSYTFIAGTGGVTKGLFGTLNSSGLLVVADGTSATNIITTPLSAPGWHIVHSVMPPR